MAQSSSFSCCFSVLQRSSGEIPGLHVHNVVHNTRALSSCCRTGEIYQPNGREHPLGLVTVSKEQEVPKSKSKTEHALILIRIVNILYECVWF